MLKQIFNFNNIIKENKIIHQIYLPRLMLNIFINLLTKNKN